jgi:hypothetical protein
MAGQPHNPKQDAEKVCRVRKPLFGLFGLSCLFG